MKFSMSDAFVPSTVPAELYSGFFIGLVNNNAVTCDNGLNCAGQLQWAESGNLFQSENWTIGQLMEFYPSDWCGVVDYIDYIFGDNCGSQRPFLCEIIC